MLLNYFWIIEETFTKLQKSDCELLFVTFSLWIIRYLSLAKLFQWKDLGLVRPTENTCNDETSYPIHSKILFNVMKLKSKSLKQHDWLNKIWNMICMVLWNVLEIQSKNSLLPWARYTQGCVPNSKLLAFCYAKFGKTISKFLLLVEIKVSRFFRFQNLSSSSVHFPYKF